jgi:GLPGLI family protein
MTKTAAECLIVLLAIAGCSRNGEESRISQGRIEYRIAYTTDSAHQKVVDLLPRKMKLVFNRDSAINIMEGFMGMYKLNSITHFRTKKCSTLLKVPKYSFLFKGKRGEPMCCFDPMDDMIIQHTGETKEILGFACQKAMVSIPGSDHSYSVYYTREIGIRHPNSTNPYKKIEGVLMEFELNMYFLSMRFTADKFVPDDKAGTRFTVPKNYHELTRDQMCQLLERYLE